MTFCFDDCVLDTDRRDLRRAGEVIAVEPKVYEVLLYLLEQRGRVVSRDKLIAQCWPEAYVSNETLNRCLSRVRQAIGQRRGGPRLIQTVYGSGYRFIGVVSAQEPPPACETVPVAVAPPMAHPVASGRAVASPPPAPARAATPAVASPTVAERRQLTVMSCALVDANRLLAELDPEALHVMLGDFRSACLDITSHYEGHVAQHLDAGLVVYFGYPQAHEDDAQRAIRAGLAMVERVRDWQAGQQDTVPGVAVRVGIHTGVVIAELAGGDAAPPLAVGATPAIASELRELALPQTVVISAPTAHLVAGYFECKALGSQRLATHSAPLLVYEVSRSSRLQTRLEVGAAGGLTPFVGRTAEVALLGERWQQVQEGLGQVVVVRGDAGIGKSRLLQVLKERIAAADHLQLECRCSPYHRHTALYPVLDLLQRLLRGQSEVLPEDGGLGQLEALLRRYDLPLDETLPLLAALLSLPLPEARYTPLTMTPQRQRERSLDVLLALLLAQAARQPVLFVVEDLHWGDPSTLEFLDLLIGQVASTAMMMVLTCRPTFELPWGQRPQVTRVVLNRLTRPQIQQMITQVAGGKRLPARGMRVLLEKTDGVPLFVEELTRMVLESGQLVERDGQYELIGELEQLTIPATLHDSLMARLDRLGTAKEIAQWGAVLGREFTYDVLCAVVPFDAGVLQEGLRQLVQAELVFQRGLLPQVHYRFKHALIQDAAYASLLTRRRQAMHERIAQTLEAQFPQITESEPELLAYHYTAAGRAESAIPYWRQAGQHAVERSANQEAANHLRAALDLLVTLPHTPARDQQELELQLVLGPVLMSTKGYGHIEVEHAYSRARALSERIETTPQLFPALWGLRLFYGMRGELSIAKALANQMLHLAQQQSDTTLTLAAHQALGVTLYCQGEFVTAHRQLDRGMSFHTSQTARVGALRDPALACLAIDAMSLWMLGYPDQALAKSQQALHLARSLSHPYSLAYVLDHAARFHQVRGEVQTSQTLAEAAIAICQEQGYEQYERAATMQRGWALTAQNQIVEGLDQMRQGWIAYQATGSKVTTAYWLWLQAEGYGRSAQVEEGLQALSEAFAFVESTKERWWEAELYRLKGELLLNAASGVRNAALSPEDYFHQALSIARRQQARSLELRAATSLARLWQSQDKYKKAYDLLAPVYAWFSEGFDTIDLQAANALLVELR